MANQHTIPLIRVNQWLNSWDKAHWDTDKGLGKPSEYFFVGSISLEKLRGLAGVTQRDIEQRKDSNSLHGYQRAHDKNRSKKINRYLKYGYPLSSTQSLDPQEHTQLINPGWLPNAIIINVIPAGDTRSKAGKLLSVPQELAVNIITEEGLKLKFPSLDTIARYKEQNPNFTEPVEIIDGQHRLFAADYDNDFNGSYEVPVVIFDNLSLAWQAYLFWTINVEPKKINPSLAFDLYPELRRQEWLDQSESIKIYQEHRSQEMTEVLWSHTSSPWNNRIELHGKRVKGHVSNAAFIRSLNSSFIKKWASGNRIGGLFGSIIDKNGNGERVIPWKRAQQAAFLIKVWKSVEEAVRGSNAAWVKAIDTGSQVSLLSTSPPAFSGEHTLLATDQGVRAIHNIFNAVFQHDPEYFQLDTWFFEESEPTEENVSLALASFSKLDVASTSMSIIANALVNKFDWRLSSAPRLDEQQVKQQGAFRGSSGYSLLLKDLIKVLSEQDKSPEVQKIALDISSYLIKVK